MQIGFIGLGHMGAPMVRNLLKAGYQVAVHDIDKKAVESIVKDGALAVTSLTELVSKADAIITMLQTGEQVAEVCMGPGGIFESISTNAVYIDCSSIDFATCQGLHEQAASANIAMIDAPVSGGVAGAENATLTIMVGGEDGAVAKAKPILTKLGKRVVHVGAPGHGQIAKMCNNMLLGVSMIGLSEAFNLGKKYGLNVAKLYEIMSNSSGQCWSLTSYCPEPGLVEAAPSNRNFAPGFTARMMLKDLQLSQHAAKLANVSTPLSAEATALYTLLANMGFAEKDFSYVIRWLNAEND